MERSDIDNNSLLLMIQIKIHKTPFVQLFNAYLSRSFLHLNENSAFNNHDEFIF